MQDNIFMVVTLSMMSDPKKVSLYSFVNEKMHFPW